MTLPFGELNTRLITLSLLRGDTSYLISNLTPID
ncbi:hypothetical protein VPHD51_0101 [Vibrio phage D51]